MISIKTPKVGLVYDDHMTSYRHLWVPNYPECPERLITPFERCSHYGYVDKCLNIKARKATRDEVLRKHSKDYLDLLEKTAQMNEEELKHLSMKFDGMYFHPESFGAAMMAAGCAIEAVDHVLNGKVQSSFAMIRPPGHHAMRNEANGYCYLNNVVLAASHAQVEHNIQKILIIDWDVHHGQGTQSFFYDDPRVLFFSTHRYEHGKFWPNLRQSDHDFVGEGDGRGYNINVPINETGLKDGDYMAMFQQILLPVAFEYQPEIVLISCGFDAAIGDPESLNYVTPACFAHLTHMVKQISRNICFIFEGGYCLKSLAECTALTLRTMLDEPCPQLPPLEPPLDSTRASILNSIRVLRPFWKCFQYQSDGDCQLDMVTPKQGIIFRDISGPEEIHELNEFEKMSIVDVDKFDEQIDALIKKTILISPPNRTCLAHDDTMLQHKQISGHHPEQPERIRRIMKRLEELKFLEECKMIESRKATMVELGLVHGSEYIKQLEEWSNLTSEELDEKNRSDIFAVRSIYFSKPTFECASLAVGCALNIVDEVVSGQSRNGIAIVRPPGHHAERDEANGFCFFNSIAIAAKYAQQKHGVKRVLIVDWDIHHGNGTQQAFYSDPSVLVISIHRRDGGNFYPIGDDNSANQVGENEGIGFNINIPWPKRQQGDAEYLAAFQQIIMPVAYEFSPDLVLVSAGFDAALGDPLGGCNVTPEMYAHMTYMLSSLASGKLVLILEGGYNLNALASSVASCVSVLLGEPLPSIAPSHINEKAARSIREVISIQQNYWKSLTYNVNMPKREDTMKWLDEQIDQWEAQKFDNQSRDVVKEALDHVKDKCPSTNDNPASSPTFESTAGPSSVANVGGVVGAGGVGGAGACGGKETFSVVDEEFHNILAQLALGEDSLQMHAVQPLSWCPHLDSLPPSFDDHINTSTPCKDCGDEVENWICLSCMEVFCSRFRSSHMVTHNQTSKHPLVLSFSDLSIWCYECQDYVDNPRLRPFQEAAYLDKFHCQMP